MLITRTALILGIITALGCFLGAQWSLNPKPGSKTKFLQPLATKPRIAHLVSNPVDPATTCDQLITLPAGERLLATANALYLLGHTPELATDLTRRLCAADPNFVREYGAALVATLVEFGHAPAAVKFAATGGPESVVWLDTAFSLWATHAPEEATKSALARDNGDGLNAASSQWAQQDPGALAEFALRKTSGPRQALALEQALSIWLDRDPQSAAEWLAQFDSSSPRS